MASSTRLGLAWANLPLRHKGLVVVAIPLSALLIATTALYLLRNLQEEVDARVKRTLEVRAGLQQVHTSLLGEETWLRARMLVALQGLNPGSVRPVTGSFPIPTILFRRLEELLAGDLAQLNRLRRVKALIETELSDIAFATAERPGEKPPAGKPLSARLEAFLLKSQVALNEIQLELRFMQDEEDLKLTDLTARATRVRTLTTIATVAGGIFGLGGGIFAVLLFTAGIVHRAQRSEQNARLLARGQALQAMPEGRDEIGRLGEALQEARALLAAREDAMLTARDEAQRANHAKSAFLANVSHELRTPLNAIIGFTRLVVRRAGDQIPHMQRENLQKVLQSAEQLLVLINGLLDLSKIEAGKMEVFVESFELTGVIEAATTTIEPSLRDGVVLIRDIGSDIPVLQTDREKLRQILVNLLSNAAKFTEHGLITVSARANGDRLSLVVADTGIGIPAEGLPHVFEEFRQVDMSSTRQHGGTGLGLAIVKRFATLLGGSVTVATELGRGSTFTVTLPLKLPKAEKALA